MLVDKRHHVDIVCGMNAEWRSREEVPEYDRKVLAFSPIYPVGHPTRFRILDGQFVRIATEIEKWLYLEDTINDTAKVI